VKTGAGLWCCARDNHFCETKTTHRHPDGGRRQPGLNAAIRGVGKAALDAGMEIIGFRDGFRGLAENLTIKLDKRGLAGILTVGGTVLGTGRDKPHRMEVNGRVRDMRDVIARNYHRNKLECAGLSRRRRHAQERAAAHREGPKCRHVAQDD
jgi:hypothetical protein